MDANEMTLPKIAVDGSAPGPRHDRLNPGPEKSSYDVNRHDAMRIKTFRYGFFRVANGPVDERICTKCHQPIISDPLMINGSIYHGKCFRCE